MHLKERIGSQGSHILSGAMLDDEHFYCALKDTSGKISLE